MLIELSLHVLDIAENATRAGADLIRITVAVSEAEDRLRIIIEDNGCGMDEETLNRVTDPFFTSRTTRKVGLGIPFYRQAALQTGGTFRITSKPGKGTCVTAEFVLDSIDRMPLGDMASTIHNLMIYHPETDFVYTYRFNENQFTLDTRQMKEILGDVSLASPEISSFIKEYLRENQLETDHGKQV